MIEMVITLPDDNGASFRLHLPGFKDFNSLTELQKRYLKVTFEYYANELRKVT